MELCCTGAFNTKGFSQALENQQLPSSTHITYNGCFNELKFSIGPRAVKPMQLHIGYARAQNSMSKFDARVNDYLAIFTKGSKDGQPRDGRPLNATIVLDISGSMGCGINSDNQSIRLELAKKAITLFFSKMRPTDCFGLITFNNSAKVVVPLQKVSEINQDILHNILEGIHASGGTTLSSGFIAAKDEYNRLFNIDNQVKSLGYQNRLILLTDVEDNSVEGAGNFIKQVETSGIHTTIIGISSAFRSQYCQKLIQVKGFNYFCATETEDLQKYLYNNFDYTFFPSNSNIQIKIQSTNLKGIQVFGTADDTKVPQYNLNSTDTYTVTKTKTSFPSELQLTPDGNLKTYGGLVLVKLNLINPEQPQFTGTVHLSYTTSVGQKIQQAYPVQYGAPLNEQFFSEESLYEAMSGFLYVYEVKKILTEVETKGQAVLKQYLSALENLKLICPEVKKKELEDLIKVANPKKKPNDLQAM